VTEADFYRDDHRRIFGHIRKLIETGKAVDVLTVSESIERSNEVDQTGGLGYLGEIANATPSSPTFATTPISLPTTPPGCVDLVAVASQIEALAYGRG
jgi:replicative DNA helicase